MNHQTKITGVVLAGGLSRRMQQDKGLLLYRQQPLVSYALTAMAQVADTVFISANRHLEDYRRFGYRVLPDLDQQFNGPLAGILAAMQAADTPVLLVMPCDSPLVNARHLQALKEALYRHQADIAVAQTHGRLHPVFLALKTDLKTDLQRYLQQGERKMQIWLNQHRLVKVDFSTDADCFVNLNTPDDLAALPR